MEFTIKRNEKNFIDVCLINNEKPRLKITEYNLGIPCGRIILDINEWKKIKEEIEKEL